MATQSASTPFDLDPTELESMDQLLNTGTESATAQVAGNVIDARVIDIDARDVLFDIGQKEDGRCPLAEFQTKPAVGDVIPVLVVSPDAEGMIRLSRKGAIERTAWKVVREAFEAEATLTGVVEEVAEKGYLIGFQGLSLFMPLSHANLKNLIRNRFSIGTELDFRVLELKERRRSAVVSHRVLLEKQNTENWQALLDNHKVGDIVRGRIVKRVSFGVFVDVAGVEGLLHANDISWKKNASFKDRFSVGQEIDLKILEMDSEAGRLSLGLKQLTEDPWEWAKRELGEGDIIEGKVTSVTDYGAFVELKEGLEGLVHVSELSWSKRQRHPKNYVSVGEVIHAHVLEVDTEKNRISLSMRQLQPDPWESLSAKVHVGEEREGKVTSVTKFGAFVEIIPDVEGLIHFKDYSWDDKIDRKMLSKGQIVKFKVLEIDPTERRIACGIKQLTPSPYALLQKKYKKGSVIEGKITSITDFGLFVDIGDGFEGLVHLSRLPEKYAEVEKMKEAYKVGDEVKTVLQGIDAAKKRISLSIKAYEHKQNRDLMKQYMVDDEPATTNSFAAFFKNKQ